MTTDIPKNFPDASEVPPDVRPARNGWAPGDYFTTCLTCGRVFVGAKRASTCAPCAFKITETP